MSQKDKNSNNQMRNRKYVVCLDTNIVISLAGLACKNVRELETLKASRKFESIKQFKTALEKRQITAIITPYVLQEICAGAAIMGPSTLDYLGKSQISILDIPGQKQEKYFETIEKLAMAYSTKLNRYTIADIAFEQGKKPKDFATRVFSCQKNKETGEMEPKNDARIMAEAATLGLPLVTNNTLDFIYGQRPFLISKINRSLTLSARAIPHTSPDIMQLYAKNREAFPKIKPTVGQIVPAKKIVGELQNNAEMEM